MIFIVKDYVRLIQWDCVMMRIPYWEFPITNYSVIIVSALDLYNIKYLTEWNNNSSHLSLITPNYLSLLFVIGYGPCAQLVTAVIASHTRTPSHI